MYFTFSLKDVKPMRVGLTATKAKDIVPILVKAKRLNKSSSSIEVKSTKNGTKKKVHFSDDYQNTKEEVTTSPLVRFHMVSS